MVNGEYFLNDDSKRIKKVAKDYVEKNVVVIGKTLQKIKILFVVSAKAWLFRDWFVGLILTSSRGKTTSKLRDFIGNILYGVCFAQLIELGSRFFFVE